MQILAKVRDKTRHWLSELMRLGALLLQAIARLISEAVRKLRALLRSEVFNNAMISLFFPILFAFWFMKCVDAYLHPECDEWLGDTMELMALSIGIITLTREKLRKHALKYGVAAILVIWLASLVTEMVHPFAHGKLEILKKSIVVHWDEQDDKISIDIHAWPESIVTKLTQISIVTEDSETHMVCNFQPIPLQGRSKIVHEFSDNEKALVNSSDGLQLRFASVFSSATVFSIDVLRTQMDSRK